MPLSVNDEMLTTSWGGSMRWDEVAALHASKYDAIEREVVILSFDNAYGEFIEVNLDEEAVSILRDRLAQLLPVPADWYQQIESLAATGGITFFANRATE